LQIKSEYSAGRNMHRFYDLRLRVADCCPGETQNECDGYFVQGRAPS
jgi:hypothetical protein